MHSGFGPLDLVQNCHASPPRTKTAGRPFSKRQCGNLCFCRTHWLVYINREATAMKSYLLTGTGLAAALAIAAPVWAQVPSTQNPSTTAPSSAYSQSPSATGSTPYSPSTPSTMSQTPPSTSQTAPYAQQAPMPSSSSAATSSSAPYATSENAEEPRTGRHVLRKMHRGHTASHTKSPHGPRHVSGKTRSPSDIVADQMNREELGRISGSSTSPMGNTARPSPQGVQPSAGRGY